AVADLTGERRIGPRIAERHDFVEQHRRPHVRILGQPLTDVGLEPVERILLAVGSPTDAGPAFAGQMSSDRLAVPTGVTGDRGDRPSPLLQRCYLHVFLWCQHRDGAPLARWQVSQPSASKGAPPRWWMGPEGGEFQ